MDQELFELCKEVYKRFPDWGLHIINGEIASYREDLRFYKNSGLESDEATIGNEPVYDIRYIYPVPLYNSDYLLKKLPRMLYKGKSSKTPLFLTLMNGDQQQTNWIADYFGLNGQWYHQYERAGLTEADTPLKAFLKLTLALHDAGEL